MARLPQPGGDSGNWGNVLNEYLSQTLRADGTLKDNVVTAAAIQDGTITEDQLDTATQIKLDYVGDVTSPVQAQLDAKTSLAQVRAMSGIAALGRPPAELFQLFSKYPDSAAVPAAFDSGQAVNSIALGGTNTQQYISGGKLRSSPNNPTGGAAAYYCGMLAASCRRIGARFTFSARSTLGGTLALSSYATEYTGGTVPPLGIHFTLTPEAWQLQYSSQNNGVLQTVTSGRFVTPLATDGTTEYQAEVTVVGNTIYIDLPDGSQVSADWSTAIGFVGRYLFFEHFANTSSTDNEVEYIAVWADSGVQRTPATPKFATTAAVKYTGSVTATALPANTPTNIPGLVVDLQAPSSGIVEVDISAYWQCPTSAMLHYHLVVDGTSSDYQAQVLAEGAASYSLHHGKIIVTGLTPGGSYQFTARAFSTAADTVIYQNPGAGYTSSIVARGL